MRSMDENSQQTQVFEGTEGSSLDQCDEVVVELAESINAEERMSFRNQQGCIAHTAIEATQGLQKKCL
jgi:hypothetical protein